jgi:hypothetical protein
MISQLSFTASLDPKMQYIGMDYTHCNSYWGPLRRAKEWISTKFIGYISAERHW